MNEQKATLKTNIINKMNAHQEIIAIILVFTFNLFLVLSYLTPRLYEINPHDGASYIESGRLLFAYGLRDLAWGPLVAFIYAPIHLFIQNSPHWFLIGAWGGNIILYALIWFGFFAIASHLRKYISKYVFIGILIASTFFFPIIKNQSDALFLAMNAFALANLIRFHQTGKLKYVWFASLFVGLGIFSRVETLLLIVPLLGFSLFYKRKGEKIHQIILAALSPIILLFLVYVPMSYITVGHSNLGLSHKSYAALTTDHAFLPGSKNYEAFHRGERIFGTGEELQGSTIRTILSNPLAVGERGLANSLKLPDLYSDIFGNIQGPIILIFSLWGLYALIRSKEKNLLLLFLIWPLQAFVSLIFIPLHVIPQMSYFFIIFSGIGITFLFSNKASEKERYVFLIISLLIGLFAIFTQNKVLFSGALLFIVVLFIALLYLKTGKRNQNLQHLPLLLLLIGGLLFGNDFSFPARTIGREADEQAVAHLQTVFSVGSDVLVPHRTIAIAAKLEPIELPGHITNIEDFVSFVGDKGIASVYVDERWPQYSEFIKSAQNRYPEFFEIIYESDNRNIEIYQINHQKMR